MMTYRRYLAGIAGVVALLGALYTALFSLQVGAPVKAAYWLRELKIVKEHIARNAGEEKIVIMGGSNALFGLESELIEERLGITTVNLSLHAGFPLEYHFDFVRQHLRGGDTLIVSPEFEMLSRNKPYNKWYVTQLLTWDSASFWRLPLGEKARMIRRVKPGRIYRGLKAMARKEEIHATKRGRAPVPEAEVLERAAKRWESGKYRGVYSYENVGPRGDIARNRGSFKGEAGKYGLSHKYHVAPRTEKTLARIRAFCAKEGIQLLYAWAATISGEELDLESDDARFALGAVEDVLRSLDIPALGEPQEFSYERTFFYDTRYHLNNKGRQLRTERLADLLGERFPPR
jgi:hypothetical protein